jgi:hypothetical protein
MTKTLGKLRQQTLKLKELDAPSSVSKGTKNFVKKHVYVVHPDANENDDDVFKATNVKKAKRFPEHGYENGQDKDVYEDFDREEYHKTQADIHNRYADAVEKKDPGKAIVYRELARKHLHQAKKHSRFHDSVTMKKGRTRGEDLLGDHRASRRMEGQRLKDRQRTEETELDEISTPFVVALSRALRIKNARSGGGGSSNRKKLEKLRLKNNKRELLLKPSMQDPAQTASMAAFDAKIGRAAEYKGHMAAKAKRDAAKKYWGEEKMNEDHHEVAAGKYSEGYEHIEALSEKDQALLVDTYNSLTKENQERFLELAESEEGVDQLIDFAITQRVD